MVGVRVSPVLITINYLPMNKGFWIDVFIATFFVFVVMWGIFRFTQLNFFNAFDSIGNALADVELTDYVFWGLREDPLVDQDIVVVNIGELTRREVAQQVAIISKYDPKVIGIDSFFDCQGGERDTINCPQLKDQLGNMMLGEAIREAGNVILVSRLDLTDSLRQTDTEDVFDSLELSDPLFQDNAYGHGFANLDTEAAFQDDVKTCRAFNPSMMVGDQRELAFSVQMAMIYDSVQTKKFLERDNDLEIINYRGNVFDIFGQNNANYRNMFYTLDVQDVFTENFVPEMIKDKIVIFGFLGRELGDPSWSDKFYTPLNNKLAGKANPDMFGVVIHANIVSMILSGQYINQMAAWQEFVMAFFICLLNVALFSLIFHRLSDWYDGITKLFQVFELLLATVLMVMIFHWYSFKLDITLTLAAVALVGDTFEIYMGMVKRMYRKIKGLKWFTKRSEEVLTTRNTDIS